MERRQGERVLNTGIVRKFGLCGIVPHIHAHPHTLTTEWSGSTVMYLPTLEAMPDTVRCNGCEQADE